MLDAVYRLAREQPSLVGPLPSADSAWKALAAAEAAAPHEIAGLLLHPQIGAWAAYTLRRHRGAADSVMPMWVDVGLLHTLAFVASIRSRLPFRTALPVRDDGVVLPGLGMVRFPAGPQRWAVAEAETVDGRCTVRLHAHEVTVDPAGAPDASWWPLRRLSVGTGPTLSVLIDDIDPQRDLADPVPPARLTTDQVTRWHGTLDQAWSLLTRQHPATASAIAEGVVSLVPLADEDGLETRSASTGEAFGSILVSNPTDDVALAVALVHEFQHIKLGGLMHLGRLTDEDLEEDRHHAPWRDDPRPAGGLLQGAYAFAGITDFWRVYRHHVDGADARLADLEFAYSRRQTSDALRTLARSGELTGWGTAVVDGLTDRVRPWLAEPTGREAKELAGLLADHHLAGWRIRHLQPAPEEIVAAADAWIAGRPPPAPRRPPVVRPHHEKRWSLGLYMTVRRRATRPDADRDAIADRYRKLGVRPDDVALVFGDRSAALAGYLDRLRLDVDDVDAWTGLLLADPAQPTGRPEWIRPTAVELTRRGCAFDPLAVARWLALPA